MKLHIEADLAAAFGSKRGVASEHDEIRADRSAHAGEGVRRQAFAVVEREVTLHSHDLFARNHPQLPPRRQLGREHLGERTRKPRRFGTP